MHCSQNVIIQPRLLHQRALGFCCAGCNLDTPKMLQKSISSASNGSKVTMMAKFGLPSFGKKAAPKKAAGTTVIKVWMCPSADGASVPTHDSPSTEMLHRYPCYDIMTEHVVLGQRPALFPFMRLLISLPQSAPFSFCSTPHTCNLLDADKPIASQPVQTTQLY